MGLEDRNEVGRLVTAFQECYGDVDNLVVVRAPGRVNLIGDHTDYNDGFVLPITIDRDVYVGIRSRDDDVVALRSENFTESARYHLAERPDFPASSWQSYVSGVIEELRLRGSLSRGAEMVVYGNVPLGAGLSSSAALEVAVVQALQSAFGFDLDPVDAVRLCQRVEHRYAGVECGIMDQFVSRLGRRQHALLLDCRTLDHAHVPLHPPDHSLALVIVDTRVKRELAASRYGQRREECRRAVETLRQAFPEISSLRDVSAAMLSEYGTNMDPTLLRRARHVVEENKRVVDAAQALRAAAFERFGAHMNASHDSLRDLYEVSCAELDHLVNAARDRDGVLGARMTGGGFGGCAVMIVDKESVADLREALRASYLDAFDTEPGFFVVEKNHQAEIVFRT